jgi:hypothetical protein
VASGLALRATVHETKDLLALGVGEKGGELMDERTNEFIVEGAASSVELVDFSEVEALEESFAMSRASK